MNILIIGTGYVGLVTGACFSEMGHHVTCLDIDEKKIKKLQEGVIPFYEPGLQEMVTRNSEAGRLAFTSNYDEGLSAVVICFIAVATPSCEDGTCDLSYVWQAVATVAKKMERGMLFVMKSTVPVGTCDQIKEIIAAELQARDVSIAFDVISNPEFLKEGSAVLDCMKPDRIIIGAEQPHAIQQMREIYSAFTLSHDRILFMSLRSAEMTKYAANAMLATRISFMNELAVLCEKIGASINDVRTGIGSDQRIGYQFLYAGIGYGGSCFPKDLRALYSLAQKMGIEMPILKAVERINLRQRTLFLEKILHYFDKKGGIEGQTLAIWGLSFKPDTDDMREAPSLSIIVPLLEKGVHLRLFDPIATANAKQLLPSSPLLHFCQDAYEAAEGADAIVLLTEWKQFRYIDFDLLCQKLKTRVLFDGRNQYKSKEMHIRGFEYFCIGQPVEPSPLKPLNEALLEQLWLTSKPS